MPSTTCWRKSSASARRPAHAGCERRPGTSRCSASDQAGGPQDLTYLAVDLPAQITAHPAGAPAWHGVGRGRLLRRRVLRRQHGPALPQPLRVRRGAQRLLRAVRQPARRDELDRPGFFRGPCLPDVFNLPFFPAARSSFPRILSGECTRRRSAGARCYTSLPIPESRASRHRFRATALPSR